MSLTPPGYWPRIIDDELQKLLRLFGAVEVRGPKWSGKTWGALNQGNDVVYIADPQNDYATRSLARIDPASVLIGKHPLVIDEWQEAPGLWDAARFSVDQQSQKGLYILTGSSSPKLKKPIHSGTGRIVSVDMRPMTLAESQNSSKEVSLKKLFDQPLERIRGRSNHSLDAIIGLALQGGWPETTRAPVADGMEISRQYVRSITEDDLDDDDAPQLSSAKMKQFLRSFARNTATMVGNATIRKDTAESEGAALSLDAISTYIDYFMRIYVLWEQPAWLPEVRSATRIRTSPKRHLVDSSLVAAALSLSPQKLKNDLKTLGFVFETMVARDLYVYANSIHGSLFHYRDNSGLEVDAIIELPDTSYAAIEIKLGANQQDDAAASLLRFISKMERSGASLPVFSAVVVGTGEFAFTRPDGIHVIPIGCLAN
jgi:predicted AAA+ superfamily ATPase